MSTFNFLESSRALSMSFRIDPGVTRIINPSILPEIIPTLEELVNTIIRYFETGNRHHILSLFTKFVNQTVSSYSGISTTDEVTLNTYLSEIQATIQTFIDSSEKTPTNEEILQLLESFKTLLEFFQQLNEKDYLNPPEQLNNLSDTKSVSSCASITDSKCEIESSVCKNLGISPTLPYRSLRPPVPPRNINQVTTVPAVQQPPSNFIEFLTGRTNQTSQNQINTDVGIVNSTITSGLFTNPQQVAAAQTEAALIASQRVVL